MATTAYTIYSHYDPKQRKALEYETGQIEKPEEDADADARWEAEAASAFKRKLAQPPRFVPATLQLDDWSTPGASTSISKAEPGSITPQNDVANWYRSLTRSSEATSQPSNSQAPSRTHSSSSLPTAEAPWPTRNSWFIQKALQSSQNADRPSSAPPSTLADILARDPPPRASEEQFHPPVFLAIGPSNKGYTMLENSGWTEGEALGPGVIRQARPKRRRSSDSGLGVKKEIIDIDLGDEDVKEMKQVIDLTQSDDQSSGDSSEEEEEIKETTSSTRTAQPPSTVDPMRKALITPIPTVLKSDRLGIGLKAKTVGPYKASMKRITHNSAALAAHLQRAEETRKRKEKHGRGYRAFARQYKEEQRRRDDMLAYMNS
ncbi:hypothetical protein Moror_13618 [Moniliophthora roreri MCA 2997]|uniref:G-patch domain-containing protein n=2 Tax=Moniliophthora roreri TaxID=221103 RepID=V2YFI1_MONRO|nr:hypothetical protein Moror_13618 [Moniliophthora roreri MCA 2997]